MRHVKVRSLEEMADFASGADHSGGFGVGWG